MGEPLDRVFGGAPRLSQLRVARDALADGSDRSIKCDESLCERHFDAFGGNVMQATSVAVSLQERVYAVNAALCLAEYQIAVSLETWRIQRAGQGYRGCNDVLLERHGTAHSGAHQNIVLEARFETTNFAARVMIDAARRLPQLEPGAHR